MQQTMAQNFYAGAEYAPPNEMYTPGLATFAHHRQDSQWSSTTGPCSPTLFDMTAEDAWGMNGNHNNHMSNLPSISSSPTSFDNFVSSPESITQQFSGNVVSDRSHENALQQSISWKSVNYERSSFSSSLEDFGADDYVKQEPDKSTRPQRRRKRNLDPKQRHAEKLEKNRKAAERCRQKQRSYVSTLQERAREEEIKRARLIAQVSQLRDDILSLKESMVSHSGCNDERIKQYLLSELQKSAQRRTSSVSSRSNSMISHHHLHPEML